MAIFNNKTLQKHLPKNPVIPPEHLSVIENWVAQIKNGTFAKMTEVAVQGPFMQQIMVELLGYKTVGSVSEGECFTVAREYPIASVKKVDLALGQFYGDKHKDNVLVPFELKGAKTKNLDAMMPGRHKTPVDQAFEYAKDVKGAKWVLLSNYVELRLYATSETSLVYEKFMLEDLLKPEEYAKFQLLLNQDNFLSGKTEKILKESESADKDISDRLYVDYKLLRENMLSRMITDNPSHPPETLIAPAQKLLDRILFISFAEDKGLIPDNSIKNAFEHNDPYNPRPIYKNFIGLFDAIDKGNAQLDIPAYNGGLFAKDDELDEMVISDALCEGFKDLAEYDFDSEVSVTVLGHIFEQSIADLEVLTESINEGVIPKTTTKSTSVSGKRKRHGVVYTPDNITQFIVANTLGSHIEDQFQQTFKDYGKYKADDVIQWKKGTKTEQKFWYAWQEKLKTIKVVDPACGSGAFLVAAFDCLYTEYEKSNDKLAELTGQHGILDLNKEILNNNLFGVDINEESIEITKLSLWLKTAERGKPLESLDANFIAGNSLGFDTPAPGNTFCWKSAFPEIFAQGGFDVVLGNPPYVRQELLGDIKPWLEEKYDVYHGVLDLYGYFFELGIKLLNPNGRMAYISSATFFKTGSGERLRQYLSSKVSLEKIIDFGDIQVFEGVTTYPAILVLQRKTVSENHKINILVLKDKLPESLNIEFDHEKGLMHQSQLGVDSWKLEDEGLYKLRKKIASNFSTLKEIYGSPYRGVLTGLNDAFVIDKKTRDQIVKANPGSLDVIKPFLEGKDIKRWHAQPRDMYLIAVPKYWTRGQLGKSKDEPLSEDTAWEWFSSNHSALAEWLTPFQERGRKRGDKGEFWWELRACAYYNDFDKTKITWGNLQNKPNFSFDGNSYFINAPSPFLALDDPYFLLGVLNSNVTWFVLSTIAIARNGGYIECKPIYINDVRVPNIKESVVLEDLVKKAINDTQRKIKIETNFIKRLRSLCPDGQMFKTNKKIDSWWLLDFTSLQKEIKKAFKGVISLMQADEWEEYFDAKQVELEALNFQIEELENMINKNVYELFDLSDEEIALIEKGVNSGSK